MKDMGQSAIKASKTHTRVADELAANEARYLHQQQERERNRFRLEVLQAQADNRSDLEDQELKDLSAWIKETNDFESLQPQSDEDGFPLRLQTEEEITIPLKRKRTTTKPVPKHLRRKTNPTTMTSQFLTTSQLLTTPLKRRKTNKTMTGKKRRTTTTTTPSLN